MVDPIYSALEAAHQKLNELLAERSRIDKEIVDWKRVIDSLMAVSESDEGDPSDVEVSTLAAESSRTTIKFTDGVRMVLRQNADRTVPISVPEIRDQLINLGFNFAKYAQPLVPIHNTLKRLEEQGEVSPLKNEQGQTLGYKWISPIERALYDDTRSAAGMVQHPTKSRLSLLAELANVNIDKSKLPKNVAAAIYGSSTTDSAGNQPLADRARLADQIKAVKKREKK